MDPRRKLGDWGERLAEAYLHKKSYRTMARNWRQKTGELDLVCRAPTGTVVFVEVKARRSIVSGYPEESVTPMKRQRLARTAELFLSEHHLLDVPHQFDLVTVLASKDGEIEIRHVEGI